MLEDTELDETEVDKRRYIEIVIREFKPLLFGALATVCFVLAALEIVAGIFFIFAFTFLLFTIITIVTAQKRNVRKLRLV
jgi:hypothetical protein